MDVLRALRELSEAVGPSGLEERAAEVARALWAPYVDETIVDRVGSLVATKAGAGEAPRPQLLLAAHVDEIALMVKQIVAQPEGGVGWGFLRLTSVGGVDIRHLYGQVVVVHGSRNGGRELPGVVAALPGFMLPESRRNKAFGFQDLVVDTGLPVGDLRQAVSVGDFISFRQPLRELLNGRAAGKALDNRASVAAIAVCLEYLHGRQHSWDVLAVATSQEETALLGAFTSGHALAPDLAIALDVTFAKGPGSNDALTYELDEGPTIAFGPNVHPGVYRALREAAAALEMRVQPEPHARSSGTDAFGLQIAREGIPTGLISIPLRYMHTPVETLATADIERAGRLLAEFSARLRPDFMDELARGLLDDGKGEAA
ncbi:MAG: hypothetical protein ACRDHL_09635 [Candidatus Promineifilaceae bacterium]